MKSNTQQDVGPLTTRSMNSWQISQTMPLATSHWRRKHLGYPSPGACAYI